MMNDGQRRAFAALTLGPIWQLRHPVGELDDVATLAQVPAALIDDPAEPAQAQPLVRVARPDVGTADLEGLREMVADCRLCGLCESRRQTVFGIGAAPARWMLIGEAPGEEEDARGEPFVGQAGRLLDNMLAALGLDRHTDVFIANVLKCRPPGNRNPAPAEIDSCRPYLQRQIELIEPSVLVLMGRFAANSVLGVDASVGSLRSKVHRITIAGRDLPAVVTYHPAYLLRSLPEKAKAWRDLRLAQEQLG